MLTHVYFVNLYTVQITQDVLSDLLIWLSSHRFGGLLHIAALYRLYARRKYEQRMKVIPYPEDYADVVLEICEIDNVIHIRYSRKKIVTYLRIL